ncbi:MAG: arylsulfatase A-like enzyme [Gammaproteobacteria bacterium]|jgi:arylsulfatase A-like enzyme
MLHLRTTTLRLLAIPVVGLAFACGGEGNTFEGAAEARTLVESLSLVHGRTYSLELELQSACILELRGTCAGPGTLNLVIVPVENAGSRATGEGQPRTVEHSGGELVVRSAVPPSDELRQRLDLRWSGSEPLAGVHVQLLESAPVASPSIIWINVDTFAATHSNLFGYGRNTTPALAQLAQESVLFEHCRANAPWTLPSTMSQLTGVLPPAFLSPKPSPKEDSEEEVKEHGRWQIPEARWTLAEMLQAAGYTTAAFLDNPYLHPGYGFAQGFQVWDTESADIDRVNPEGGLAHMTPRMLAWLDGLPEGKPSFLFLQPFDVHEPYVPSADNAELFREDGLTADLGEAPVAWNGRSRGSVNSSVVAHLPGANPLEHIPQRVQLGPLVDDYDRSLRTLDDALGEFVEALRARGLLDNSILIVSADHGESTTGHEALFEHMELWEDVLHVPLLIRLPRGEQGGRRVPDNVQNIDIYPTLAELCGLPHGRSYLDGKSLVRALEGQALAERDHYAYAEELNTMALVRGTWKLHYRRPTEGDPHELQRVPEARRWREQAFGLERNQPMTLLELQAALGQHPDRDALLLSWRNLRKEILRPRPLLFDVGSDPFELEDVSANQGERVGLLHAAGVLLEEASASAFADVPPTGPSFEPDAAMRATLRAIGYGGDD